VFGHESYGPIPYEYELLKDSVFIFFSRSENKKGWKIAQTCDSILILGNNKEKRVLHTFDLKYSYFEAPKDSLAYEEFEMDFISRYLIRKYKNSDPLLLCRLLLHQKFVVTGWDRYSCRM